MFNIITITMIIFWANILWARQVCTEQSQVTSTEGKGLKNSRFHHHHCSDDDYCCVQYQYCSRSHHCFVMFLAHEQRYSMRSSWTKKSNKIGFKVLLKLNPTTLWSCLIISQKDFTVIITIIMKEFRRDLQVMIAGIIGPPRQPNLYSASMASKLSSFWISS